MTHSLPIETIEASSRTGSGRSSVVSRIANTAALRLAARANVAITVSVNDGRCVRLLRL